MKPAPRTETSFRGFNTTLVQLKGCQRRACLASRAICFNTTLVQLKVDEALSIIKREQAKSFNTTLVQLKAHLRRITLLQKLQFQYHTGPIKSCRAAASIASTASCFNTTLVQLKANPPQPGLIDTEKFQYHTGPIKSPCRKCLENVRLSGFNTTLVQLKGQSARRMDVRAEGVSIPHWSN